MIDIETRRQQLMARRAELAARLETIEHELDEPLDKDLEDQAVDLEDDEVLETLGLQGQKEVRMIDAAMARIAEGEYGYCTNCGAEIASERLDLLPATPFCRNCAV
ncbi:MAG: TraR/DksA family transcriptional regulator [Rhodobacteraceae bacterium]|nr:TraR/DksA family transcriptional regulator [Paracoccaceae bacterium]